MLQRRARVPSQFLLRKDAGGFCEFCLSS
jgi:hypothetical protein